VLGQVTGLPEWLWLVCSMPGKWAEFHHIRPWNNGGPSDPHNGCLLCRRHHTLIHQDEWQIRLGADRLPEIIPPTSHDLEQRPLRNTLHRPPVRTWPQVG
jgi:HNH endonuclease